MMSWIRWRFTRPTAEDVVQRLVGRLHALGASEVVATTEPPMLRYTLQGAQMQTHLVHLLQDLRRLPGAARTAAFDEYVNGVVRRPVNADSPENATDYASVQGRLMPLLRTRADVEQHARDVMPVSPSLSAAQADARRAGNATPWRPLTGDFVAMLGLDSPTSTARVTQDMLDRWGVSYDTAFDDALQNLRGLPESRGWMEIAPGLWQGGWNDSYDASRVLLPDVIYRSGVRHPVVMVPVRHVLLVADSQDETALALMASASKQLMQEQTRWLSSRPLQLVERAWRPFKVPASLRPVFDELVAIDDVEAYAEQKQWLDQQQGDDPAAPFVGSAKMLRLKDSDRLVSYSVWSSGVVTLLPCTDLVAFSALEQPDEAMVVPWADVQRIVGHHLVPVEGLHPPRLRVTAFPDDAEKAALRAASIL